VRESTSQSDVNLDAAWQPIQRIERTVRLNIYDLQNSKRRKEADEETGLFHAGVEVFGQEWNHGATGVTCHTPRHHPSHTYRTTVPMGETKLTEPRFRELISRLQREWPGTKYNLVDCNCQHFCNELLKELGLCSIPSWIDWAARVGSFVDTASIKVAEDTQQTMERVQKKSTKVFDMFVSTDASELAKIAHTESAQLAEKAQVHAKELSERAQIHAQELGGRAQELGERAQEHLKIFSADIWKLGQGLGLQTPGVASTGVGTQEFKEKAQEQVQAFSTGLVRLSQNLQEALPPFAEALPPLAESTLTNTAQDPLSAITGLFSNTEADGASGNAIGSSPHSHVSSKGSLLEDDGQSLLSVRPGQFAQKNASRNISVSKLFEPRDSQFDDAPFDSFGSTSAGSDETGVSSRPVEVRSRAAPTAKKAAHAEVLTGIAMPAAAFIVALVRAAQSGTEEMVSEAAPTPRAMREPSLSVVRFRPAVQLFGPTPKPLPSLHEGEAALLVGAAAGLYLSKARRTPPRSRNARRRLHVQEDELGELTDEERERLAPEMDGMAPYRNIVGLVGLLLLGKSLPDAIFTLLKHFAGIRGSEVLDTGMLGLDAVLAMAGAAILYCAIVFMAPRDLSANVLQKTTTSGEPKSRQEVQDAPPQATGA